MRTPKWRLKINGQSRLTGNIGYTRYTTKTEKDFRLYAELWTFCTQANTNKTWSILQTTGGNVWVNTTSLTWQLFIGVFVTIQKSERTCISVCLLYFYCIVIRFRQCNIFFSRFINLGLYILRYIQIVFRFIVNLLFNVIVALSFLTHHLRLFLYKIW